MTGPAPVLHDGLLPTPSRNQPTTSPQTSKSHSTGPARVLHAGLLPTPSRNQPTTSPRTWKSLLTGPAPVLHDGLLPTPSRNQPNTSPQTWKSHLTGPAPVLRAGLLPTPSRNQPTTSPQTWKSLFPSATTDLSLRFIPPTEGKVVITPEDYDSAKWDNSLVGYFVGRSPPMASIKENLARAWRGIRFDLTPMPSGFFLFTFQDYESGQRVLERGLISVNGHPLVLKRWTFSFSFRREEMSTVPIWINLPYLRMGLRSRACIGKIASAVGKPLFADRTALDFSRPKLARVCVEISASSPLPDTVPIVIDGGEKIIQKVQYYWKPSACAHCKIFNHSTKGCKSPASTSAGDTKPILFSRMIKIMSYNVWFREDVEVIGRMKAIGHLIHQCSPDVIFFQEVTPNIYKLFQNSDWWKVYKSSVSREKVPTRKYFCMLLSKLPVKEFGCIHFEDSMGKELCLAEIDVGMGKKLVAATTHLKSPTAPDMYSLERVAQARKALCLLRCPTNVVFGGDMNWDENTDESFPLLDGWVDAWTELRPSENGFTYDTKSNQMLSSNRPLQKRLDRFICKLKDFKLVSVDMIGTEAIPGLTYYNKGRVLPVFPSDHYGLLLTISSILSPTSQEAMPVLQSSPAATFTWTPPQHGQLKVNFGGSVRGGNASAGFVIRDASGDAILGGNIAFALCSISEAELRGAWIGLQAAVERLRATSIWLEGDSQAVISWVNRGELSKAPTYSDLQDIWSWITTLDSFKATYVFREGNKPADWLAESAVSTSQQIWSSDFPAPLLSLLSADADSHVYTRPC